jgi:hypothetical protein
LGEGQRFTNPAFGLTIPSLILAGADDVVDGVVLGAWNAWTELCIRRISLAE